MLVCSVSGLICIRRFNLDLLTFILIFIYMHVLASIIPFYVYLGLRSVLQHVLISPFSLNCMIRV